MKKKISLLLVFVLVLALFAACGGKTEQPSLDISALTEALIQSTAFSGSLSELSGSKVPAVFGFDSAKQQSAVFYCSDNGTNKERIVIVTAKDDGAAKEILSSFQTKVNEWIESDKNYSPDEVPKLEKAILRQTGINVILVIANAPEVALDIVSKAL